MPTAIVSPQKGVVATHNPDSLEQLKIPDQKMIILGHFHPPEGYHFSDNVLTLLSSFRASVSGRLVSREEDRRIAVAELNLEKEDPLVIVHCFNNQGVVVEKREIVPGTRERSF